MENNRVVKLAVIVYSEQVLSSKDTLSDFLSDKTFIYNRMYFTLRDYLEQHSEKFDRDMFYPVIDPSTVTGMLGMVNRSEIDIVVNNADMSEAINEKADFPYPFGFSSHTFSIQKPTYKPEVFGILKTFSFSLWMAIIAIFFIMSLIYYVAFKVKYPISKILLHIFAVLFNQNSIIKPSRWAENMLLYSWVVGAMFIYLAYNSVFLSFLAIPPVTAIRDLSDLATAVKKGEYRCVGPKSNNIKRRLRTSDLENLRVIAKDINNNSIQYEDVFMDFYTERKKLKLAFIIDSDFGDITKAANKFVSEDCFLERLIAMIVQKNFCCKEMLNTFIHRLMASGLYFKFKNDRSFIINLHLSLLITEQDSGGRKITLIDVAPAFIVLIFGYLISIPVLIGEIVSDHRSRKKNNQVLHFKD